MPHEDDGAGKVDHAVKFSSECSHRTVRRRESGARRTDALSSSVRR